MNKIIPAVDVLNSTEKFATAASTLSVTSSAIRTERTTKTRWLLLVKEKKGGVNQTSFL
jgi:hypothetical protein